MEVLSVEKVKLIDKAAIKEIGIPSIVLMENAAQGIFENIINKSENFIIFCGEGNNGGDGLGVARKLLLNGKNVKVYVVGNGKNRSEEFNINFRILSGLTQCIGIIKTKDDIPYEILGSISDNSLIIDSVLGLGLNRIVDDFRYSIIKEINKSKAKKIAIDIPSGLDGDTGRPLGISVVADETYTIQTLKVGFFNREARKYLGDVKTIDIGIPAQITNLHSDGIRVLEKVEYSNILPKRDRFGHKGNYGRVLILAGSLGLTGAAILSSRACIECGTGLTTLLIDGEAQKIVAENLVEVMTVNYSEEEKIKELILKADVIACGPGLGMAKKQINMLEKCIKESSCPLVIDADGLNIISERPELLEFLKGRAVFTPHPGEMSRLINKSVEDIERNRIKECREFSRKYSVVTILKGHNTVISDGGEVIINTTGNSKMASGGMGDALTGIIASFIGQGIDIFNSAKLACFIHGLAGEEAGEGKYSVKASDVIAKLPYMLLNISKNKL